MLKTEEQEAIWGGTAGEQFDPCYHLACDTFDNVDLHALEVNSDLIAFAQLTFAYSTESVNGVPGKKVPGPPTALPAPAGPEGTFAGGRRRPRAWRPSLVAKPAHPDGGGPRDRPHHTPHIEAFRCACQAACTPGCGGGVGPGGLTQKPPLGLMAKKTSDRGTGNG